jgi:predicted RNA-binding protein YlqC (UPF0109 family)
VSEINDEYVAGDINTIEPNDDFDDDGDDGEDGNDVGNDDRTSRASTAAAVLEYVATSLAEDPAAVSVDVSEQGSKILLSLNVGPSDMGRVIGRRGRTAQALRTLIAAAGARDGVTTSVDIVD